VDDVGYTITMSVKIGARRVEKQFDYRDEAKRKEAIQELTAALVIGTRVYVVVATTAGDAVAEEWRKSLADANIVDT